jgi:hypothetical protein
MRRVLPIVALLVCALPGVAQERLRIEGLQGRVETLGGSERVELLTGLGPRDCGGPGLIEAGSMASARLFWPTRASLLTQGRAGLEWRGAGETFLRVFELQHGELEVRRGPLQLELPWGWNARFDAGAYRLRSLPGGALEIDTVAGRAPHLWWSRDGRMWPCAGPQSGERALLPPDWSPERRGTPESRSTWPDVSWPWGQAPEALQVVVEPVPAPAPAPAPVEPAPLPPFDPALWRGHARAELELVGPCAVEKRADLSVERTPTGGIVLRLRSDAGAPAWVMRANSDLELEPGTLALLDAEGRLRANLGAVRSHARPAERPAPEVAGIAARP